MSTDNFIIFTENQETHTKHTYSSRSKVMWLASTEYCYSTYSLVCRHRIASFPGLPQLQFLTTWSMQRLELGKKAWE